MLGAARQSFETLKRRVAVLGRHSREADHLMWAWEQCAPGFEDFVHDTNDHEWMDSAPPQPSWLNGWRMRVAAL